MLVVMKRDELTEKILSAKAMRKVTWADLARAVGRSEVWTTSALLGQQAMGIEEAQAAGTALGLAAEDVALLQTSPSKGSLGPAGHGPPTDPLIYRFHEIVEVYGTTLKELIQEKFGDGIMSAIDFDMKIDRVPDPKGDRVAVVMTGKFLAYKKW
jgi:cyanate lyase